LRAGLPESKEALPYFHQQGHLAIKRREKRTDLFSSPPLVPTGKKERKKKGGGTWGGAVLKRLR